MLIGQILEAVMLICFGLSWPLNAYKNYKAATAVGTSWQFILLITLGYVAGIAAKFVADSVNWVLIVYFINLVALGVNWWVYFRNVRLDKVRSQAQALPTFKTNTLGCVIVASDGSQSALEAAKFASERLGISQAKQVQVVSVASDDSNLAVSRAQNALDVTEEVLHDAGVACTSTIVTGSPAAAIASLAADEHADMVVVGSRGLSGIKSAMLGSVSRKIIENVTCPVLVTK